MISAKRFYEIKGIANTHGPETRSAMQDLIDEVERLKDFEQLFDIFKEMDGYYHLSERYDDGYMETGWWVRFKQIYDALRQGEE
jgi:limonene-1,2-epoxide hydrolase